MATINGTNGDDLLFALAAGDILNGLEGDDLLIAEGINYTTLNGGAGNDNLWLNPAFSTRGPAEHNVLDGGEGNDYFGGSGNANTLSGGAGDDVFEVAGNGNTLNGDAGHDLLGVVGSGNVLNGGSGNDQFHADSGEGNTLNGDEGDDVYTGVNFNNNAFNGGDGNDYTSAPVAYNSTLDGGAGDDYLAVGGDNNILNGGAGNDYLEAFDSEQPGTNILLGGDGDDVLTVYHGGTLTGGAGSDRFDLIQTGADTFITDFQHDATRSALRAEDVLNLEVWQTFAIGEPLDKSLNALVGQGYLVVGASGNVGGDAAFDTVVQFDIDGRTGPAAPQTIVTLLDTTLTTLGADKDNWLT